MTFIGITTAQSTGIGLRRACTQCGATVEKVSRDNHPHDPTFCAHCGHRFNSLPDGLGDKKLVELLNAAIQPTPAEPEDARKETGDA